MSYDASLIAPFDSPEAGLVEYYKPWLVGNDAFPILEDAYCFRGRVRKREGTDLLGTLPTFPVQGLKNYYIPATGDINLIGFSTTKAYRFNNTTQVFDDISTFQTSGAAISWTGGNDDFFWSANYANSLWVTNFVDPLRFWNGNNPNGWNNQKPLVSGATRLDKCLIVIPHKGRLVTLNTVEGGVAFRNRARWSQQGTPYVLASGGDPAVILPVPFSTDDDAWRSDIPGKGGFADADTNERIVSAGIVRDTLIVFFQRSTWRLTYTGNQIQPFFWDRLNTQYGSEATHSTISFDEHLLTFSRFGFVAADTNSVHRIVEKIPDQSFSIEAGITLSVLQRIHGIRDFYRQTAYWAYPEAKDNLAVPDKVLNYAYLDKTWARFNQKFRCYGYYNTFNDLTWASATFTWESADDPWNSPWAQASFPQVVAGDAALSGPSAGNVYIVYDIPFESQEATALAITNITAANPAVITTSVSHNFLSGNQVTFFGVTGTMAAALNTLSFTLTVLSPTTSSIPLDTSALVYGGGGQVTSGVSYNFDVTTKAFNPYLKDGNRCKLGYVDIYCTGNPGSEITVDHIIDEQGFSILTRKVSLSSAYPRYVRIYLGATARLHQLKFYLSASQLSDEDQGQSQFEMQGIVLWTRRCGKLKTS